MNASLEETFAAIVDRAVEKHVAPLRAEVAALRAELAERDRPPEFLDAATVCRRLGIKPSTLSMRITRGTSKLAALAQTIDSRRVWRSSDIDALIAGGLE